MQAVPEARDVRRPECVSLRRGGARAARRCRRAAASSRTSRARGSSISRSRWASSDPIGASAHASNPARTGSSSRRTSPAGPPPRARSRARGLGAAAARPRRARRPRPRRRSRARRGPRPSRSGYGSSGSHSRTRSRAVPTVTSAYRPSGNRLASTIRATVPTSNAGVAATDLRAALDQHDAELGLAGEAVLDQRAVAGLEDVQRERGVREQHRAEREHRQRACRHGAQFSRARSACASAATFAASGSSRTSARASSAAAASVNRPSEPSSVAVWRRSATEQLGEAEPEARHPHRVDRAALEVRALQVVEHAQQDRPRSRSARGTRARTARRDPAARRRPRGSRRRRGRARRGTGRRTSRDRRRPRRGSGRASRRRAAPSPMRRPISIMRMLRLIGIPRRRSMTSSSSELRGSE